MRNTTFLASLWLVLGLMAGCSPSPDESGWHAAKQGASDLVASAKLESALPALNVDVDRTINPSTAQMKQIEMEQSLPARGSSVQAFPQTGFKTLAQAAKAGVAGVSVKSTQHEDQASSHSATPAGQTPGGWARWKYFPILAVIGLWGAVWVIGAYLFRRRR